MYHKLYHNLLIHFNLSLDRCIAIINMSVQMLSSLLSVLWGMDPDTELLDHIVILF